MAVLRERPYVQFNFLVDLGTGSAEGADAGFQEVSGIGMEVTVSEYRNGNEKENSVRKITGLNTATDVTLKRGVIGSLTLYNWLDQIRRGDQTALKNVVIQLQNDGPPGARDEPGAPGWELFLPARARDGEHVIRKATDDGFRQTSLSAVLTGRAVRHLAVCGVLSDMCVSATAGPPWTWATPW